MEREIKHRVWHNKRNEFLKEFLIMQTLNSEGKDEITIFERDADKKLQQISKDHTSIVQCSGLKDKNGTEIYEGDILSDKGIIVGVVRFGEYKMKNFTKHDQQHNHLGWYVGEGINKVSLEDIFYNLTENHSITNDVNYIEVGGNIYENKDLLK